MPNEAQMYRGTTWPCIIFVRENNVMYETVLQIDPSGHIQMER